MRPFVAFAVLGGLVIFWVVYNFYRNVQHELNEMRELWNGEGEF